jgi:cyclic-di-GMP phosphodiesterase TipF (flagellum assembly factor)
MAQQFAFDDDTPAYNPRYADAFVVFAVTVLSLAVGVWCLLRLGMALWGGTVTALAAYTVLLSIHLLVRRSLAPAEGGGGEREHADLWMRAPLESPALADDGAAEADADAPPSADAEIARWAEAARAERDTTAAEAPTRAPDPFSFRPLQEPSLPTGPGLSRLPDSETWSADARRPAAEEPQVNVEQVLKKLADALNQTPSTVRAEKPATAAGTDTEAVIGQSVAALQAAARSMARTPTGFEPAAADDEPAAGAPSWWPHPAETGSAGPREPRTPPTLDPRLERIAEAVVAERMEVLLEPIHALAEGRARHFEVSMRLRTADGAALEQSEFSRVARGSGLMPRIDAARMVRAARVARKLGERGRQGSVLSAVTGESLTDARFVDAATAEPGSEGGMGLVLAFAQAEVRAFTAGHAEALGALAAAGFSFALEQVTDLDMDFAGLKEMGFGFVELDAPVFLDGLPAAGGRVPASDICRHLADFGLTLIVGRIEDDWLLARILGFGVLFGKGTLFGGARLVKDEVVAAPAAAA